MRPGELSRCVISGFPRMRLTTNLQVTVLMTRLSDNVAVFANECGRPYAAMLRPPRLYGPLHMLLWSRACQAACMFEVSATLTREVVSCMEIASRHAPATLSNDSTGDRVCMVCVARSCDCLHSYTGRVVWTNCRCCVSPTLHSRVAGQKKNDLPRLRD